MFGFLLRLAQTDDSARLEQALAWLYGFIRPHRLAIAALLGLSMCATFLVLAQPMLTKLLIDKGLLAGNYPVLVATAATMVCAGMVSNVLGGANRYLHTRLSGRILFSLRSALYAHLQKLSPAFYGRRRIGDLLSRLDGDVAEIQRFALDSLFSAVSSLIGLAGAVMLLLSLSWKLSLLIVVLIPFEFFWLRCILQKVERDARSMRQSSADLSSFLVETLPAMKFIQSAGQQGAEQRRLDQLGDGYMQRLLNLQLTEFFTQSVPGTLTSVSRAGAFLVGGYWVIHGEWQLGSLIAFSTYMGMAVGPVKSLLGLYVAIQRVTVSLGRVIELQREPLTVRQPPHPVQPPLAGCDLRLEDVWFAHAERNDWVLRGITATIPAGAKVAISGASGTGKSTLVDLLLRFYDPPQGRVLFGGTDLRHLDLYALRRRIAVVSQEIILFRGSLAANIAYGAPQSSRETIARIASMAGLDGLIESMPNGLDSEVGERGQQLSGGQKQRVAIARALLQDASILVLDESTSALDEATERKLIAEVDRLFASRTRILISHRASTLARADLHLTLADGMLRTHRQEHAQNA